MKWTSPPQCTRPSKELLGLRMLIRTDNQEAQVIWGKPLQKCSRNIVQRKSQGKILTRKQYKNVSQNWRTNVSSLKRHAIDVRLNEFRLTPRHMVVKFRASWSPALWCNLWDVSSLTPQGMWAWTYSCLKMAGWRHSPPAGPSHSNVPCRTYCFGLLLFLMISIHHTLLLSPAQSGQSQAIRSLRNAQL